jgi:RNA polymerase sigma factor (sigma-70 family)
VGEVVVNRQVRAELVSLLPRLRRFAYGLTGSLDAGDDLVQSACERALMRLDQFQPGTRLDSWMYRIVQNLWIDQRRAQQARLEAGMEPADLETLAVGNNHSAVAAQKMEAGAEFCRRRLRCRRRATHRLGRRVPRIDGD